MKNPFVYSALPWVFSLFLFCGMGSCQKDDSDLQQEPGEIRLTTEQRLLLDEGSGFAFALFREMSAEAGKRENVFMSPLSVSLALAMTYNGAGGTTRDAMKQTMQLPGLTDIKINEAYHRLIKDLVSVDKKVTLNIANSIWYRQGFQVQPPFIETNKKYYDAEVRELDFGRPDAVTIINGWVAQKTNNLIDKIIERISNQTVMILLNAIYFKGEWKYEFSKSETSPQPFFPDPAEQLTVPMMHQLGSFHYYHNELFAVAELPYGRGNYSMLVFLPHPGISVHEVINTFGKDTWEEVSEGLSGPQRLIIQLPKFRFSFELKLNDVLTTLGMGVAFSPSEADFSGINPNEQLFISEVRHKAFVDVNEEGTEAAAVTSVVIDRTSAGPGAPIAFYVNRPFVFMIREKFTNALIFAGRVMEPEL